jgi:Bacterial SH3 domain
MAKFAASIVLGLAACLTPTLVLAGSCQGVVKGLSETYNKASGSGFLAVRQKASAKSRKLGELFNDDLVEVVRRQGRDWIYVYTDTKRGWVFQRFVSRGCDSI